MPATPQQPDRDFTDLVERVLDHEAGVDDIARLNSLLPQNPVALRYFVEMRMLHDALDTKLKAAQTEQDAIKGQVIPYPPKPRKTGHPWRRLAVAAAVALAATASYWGVDRLLHPAAFEVVALQGTGSADVPAPGSWIRQGQRIILPQGAVELLSSDGNSLTLQGPGRLTIHSPHQLTLDSGRLWAKLEGEPVRIQVPRGEVTDIGTTFGIDQSSSDSTRIDVFDGRVRFSHSTDTSRAVEASAGESLVSTGSEWTPQRGAADAARYPAGNPTSSASTVLIDWSSFHTVTNPASDGKHWNSLGKPGQIDLKTTPLLDSTGADSGASVAVRFGSSGSAKDGQGSGFNEEYVNDFTVQDPFDEPNVVREGIYNNKHKHNGSDATATITLSGLLPSTRYDFSAVGGRTSSGVDGLLSIRTGTSAKRSYPLSNKGKVARFRVTSCPSGTIALNFRKAAGASRHTTNAIFSAMSFHTNPEPAGD